MKVLLIDIETKRADELKQLLEAVGAETVTFADGQTDIYQAMQKETPEIVIMDVDSPTRDSLEDVAALQATSLQPVLMLAKQDNVSVRRLATEIGISLYVVDALSAELVQSLIDVTISHFRSFETLKKEVSSLKETLEERKKVSDAKCMLMEQYKLTEAKAYELLRKTAMQQRLTLVEVAGKITSTIGGQSTGGNSYAASGPL